MVWICVRKLRKAPSGRVYWIGGNSIIKGKERLRKIIDKTIKKYLNFNGLNGKCFMRGHSYDL